MNIDCKAYEGMRMKGVTETVLSGGKVIIDKGEYRGTPGEGRFLRRSTFGWKSW